MFGYNFIIIIIVNVIISTIRHYGLHVRSLIMHKLQKFH